MTAVAVPAPPAARPTSSGAERASLRAARWWLWGLVAAFVVHDGEEALWLALHGGGRAFGRWETFGEAATGIVFELTVGWVVVLLAARALRPGPALQAYGILLGGWVLHGVVHLVTGLRADGYTMGVVTALPCAVVFGVLAFRALVSAGLLGRRALVVSVLAGAPAGYALVVVSHLVGRLLA